MGDACARLTLQSSAPTLVYEEGSLIKRAIRDLYNKDVDEILVAGEEGYREAKDFMRLLMPSHAKNVQPYRDPQPIFAKAGAEAQLDAMFSNHVTLKSGGYLVINQTEALVAIDVNSGRSTREHNIEDTALRTNLEAADEVARQLRLRDLAGLIVVDFIDMEEGRNNRAVERRHQGCAEERPRPHPDRPHLAFRPAGNVAPAHPHRRARRLDGRSARIAPAPARSAPPPSIALHVLRVLEDALIKERDAQPHRAHPHRGRALHPQPEARPPARAGAALRRHHHVWPTPTLTGTVYHAIERGEPATPPVSFARFAGAEEEELEDDEVDVGSDEDDEADPDLRSAGSDDAQRRRPEGEDAEGEAGDRRRKRRRRRRGRDRDVRAPSLATDEQPSDAGFDEAEDLEEAADEATDEVNETTALTELEAPSSEPPQSTIVTPLEAKSDADESQAESAEPRRRRRRRATGRSGETEAAGPTEGVDSTSADETPPAPRRSRRSRGRATEEEAPSLLGYAPPSADRDVGADTAKSHPPEIRAGRLRGRVDRARRPGRPDSRAGGFGRGDGHRTGQIGACRSARAPRAGRAAAPQAVRLVATRQGDAHRRIAGPLDGLEWTGHPGPFRRPAVPG